LLFHWFVGLAIDDAVWYHSTFSKNRERLLDHAAIEAFSAEVIGLAEKAGLRSDEHFSVDGTLIKAWASHKSFQPKDAPPNDSGPGRNAEACWRGNPMICLNGECYVTFSNKPPWWASGQSPG
jgi:hypothetical protein